MMLDTLKTQGADSFAGRLVSILRGSSENHVLCAGGVFYAVNIRNTRYAAACGVFADVMGLWRRCGWPICFWLISGGETCHYAAVRHASQGAL